MDRTVKMTTINQYPPIVRYDEIEKPQEPAPGNGKFQSQETLFKSSYGREEPV